MTVRGNSEREGGGGGGGWCWSWLTTPSHQERGISYPHGGPNRQAELTASKLMKGGGGHVSPPTVHYCKSVKSKGPWWFLGKWNCHACMHACMLWSSGMNHAGMMVIIIMPCLILMSKQNFISPRLMWRLEFLVVPCNQSSIAIFPNGWPLPNHSSIFFWVHSCWFTLYIYIFIE